ncbi:MAG: glycosyltransferase [Bryobacterales bacterium]|nr:glycosyltransferase [Bryobacterales bacterium]
MIFTLIAVIAIGYQAAAIVACLRTWIAAKRVPEGTAPGPVSVVKPIRGLDPALREAIESHTVLQGDYEFLCGVSDPADPALPVLREFPQLRVVNSSTRTANGKAGVLIDLVAAARHPILVLNDSDIQVAPDYLRRVTAPLADPAVGLVTCLYRPIGDTFAARFEGLGIATDFAPSTLVARLAGVDEFAMGSTLAFRRRDLDRIGGFAVIADYLADDYQLGHRIHVLGLKCVLSDVIVDTHMGGGWRQVWAHQVRWARTIRGVKFGGYLGLPITNATLWAAVAAAAGRWELAGMLLAARLAMAWTSGCLVIRSRDVLRLFLLVPARDLFGFAVWLTGLFGRSVVWRGLRLRLAPDGKIIP